MRAVLFPGVSRNSVKLAQHEHINILSNMSSFYFKMDHFVYEVISVFLQ